MKISIFGAKMNIFVFLFVLILVLGGIGGCSYRAFWWTNVENYNIAYRWDKSDGSITRISHTGWCRVTPVITEIYTIDSRPMQIRIEANNRVLNAMLVQFNPEGANDFFGKHGLDNYDQAKLGEILKSYAYEGVASVSYNRDSLQLKYKFLKILGGTSGGFDKQNTAYPLKDSL
jgi:hypothetical protein